MGTRIPDAEIARLRSENKYGLKFSDIKRFKIVNAAALRLPPFWRNNIIKAWCLSGTAATSNEDEMWGDPMEYWIGFYDSGKIQCDISSSSCMVGEQFERFFNPRDLDTPQDVLLEERLLKRLNWLLDSGIVECPKGKKDEKGKKRRKKDS
jgi:hypothetical protein